jgi:hypothetical protein
VSIQSRIVETVPRPRTSRDRLAAIAFGLWVPAILILGAYLLAGHLVALPAPEARDRRLVSALAATGAADQGRWRALHFLDENCGCSQRVVTSLLARRPLPGLAERIVFITRTPAGTAAAATAARGAGFAFETVAPEDLERRFGVEAAPLLVAVAPDNRVRYLGGYTDRKQGPSIEDRDILQRTMRGERVAALPLFGCAVSKQLAAQLDPLRLR